MKIGLFITARLKSTRLPLKLLLDLKGRTIIERVIDRAKLISNVDTIVLCTSLNPQDKPLADIALKNTVHYYLGSEEDVLQRLLDAAKFFNLDYILSITGENPFFSIEYANRTIDEIKNSKADFTCFEGLPIGCMVYGLRVNALEVVCKIKKEIDTEIWGPLINRPEIFRTNVQKVEKFYERPSLRITNDFWEDYMFLQTIYSHFDTTSSPSLYDVLSLLDKNPNYLKIHGERKQAGLSKETIDRINNFYTENKDRILKLKKSIY